MTCLKSSSSVATTWSSVNLNTPKLEIGSQSVSYPPTRQNTIPKTTSPVSMTSLNDTIKQLQDEGSTDLSRLRYLTSLQRIAVLLPLVIKYLNEGWSAAVACRKAGVFWDKARPYYLQDKGFVRALEEQRRCRMNLE